MTLHTGQINGDELTSTVEVIAHGSHLTSLAVNNTGVEGGAGVDQIDLTLSHSVPLHTHEGNPLEP